MKLELRNFAGKTGCEYRINLKTRKEEDFVFVSLYYDILNPLKDSEEWTCMDVKSGLADTYEEALYKALEQAEKAWNIKLIKEQLKTA